jgi:hypothetical protein
MATLYYIDQAILNCIDMETGEIIDVEQLERLQIERDAKIENVICWIKNLESDASAIKAEAKSLTDRANKAENKAAELKDWLVGALGGQTFNSARCAVSWRKSESVEIEDEKKIPLQYMIKKTEYKPDKTAIKIMLKSGTEIQGCKIVKKLNPQIK